MSAIDRARLAKLLGMLGATHSGEIVAAGRAAHAFVRAAGTTWSEVLAPRPDSAAEEACRTLLAENEEIRRRFAIAQQQNDVLYTRIAELGNAVALAAQNDFLSEKVERLNREIAELKEPAAARWARQANERHEASQKKRQAERDAKWEPLRSVWEQDKVSAVLGAALGIVVPVGGFVLLVTLLLAGLVGLVYAVDFVRGA
jgi:septal ring factor EnvC (AmiA/AmiB activator)